jgi:hypothetical protein
MKNMRINLIWYRFFGAIALRNSNIVKETHKNKKRELEKTFLF